MMLKPNDTTTRTDATDEAIAYDALYAQVNTLIETLGAAIERHAKDARDYPDDLLRLKNRLIIAITELSGVTEDDLTELIGEATNDPPNVGKTKLD